MQGDRALWCYSVQRSYASEREASIGHGCVPALICFSSNSNLHVTGFSSCRITTMIHSYLVWFLWWLRHGAIGPIEATLFGVNVDWIDNRIYTFKFSNSLKCNSWPYRFAPLMMSCGSCGPRDSSPQCLSTRVKPFETARNLVFTAALAFTVTD